MKAKTLLASVLTLAAAGSAYSAAFYIGDAALETTAVTDSGGTDTSGGGSITYGLHGNPYTNASGSAQLLQLTEVNFWDDDISGSTLTPFVAIYNNGGVGPAANYSFLSIGDAITATAGLNNASFNVGGSNPTVTLNNGDTIIAGFYQDGRIVPFGNAAGETDYLDEDNELGAGVGGTFGENAQWNSLGRRYSFNVGFDVVPEPSTTLLIPAALGGLLLARRRRR